MFKKFLNGLAFGSGFGIAFLIIWFVGMSYILPASIKTAYDTSSKEIEFSNPHLAEIAEPNNESSVPSAGEFSFFKDSEYRIQIPENGGILSMSPISTKNNADRPSTYQLWLTHTELWQIKTVGKKTEIEKLPYPNGASAKTLDSIMRENLGMASRQSTMTVSDIEINNLKSNGESWRDESLNGDMKITVEGVVFVLPNPYGA